MDSWRYVWYLDWFASLETAALRQRAHRRKLVRRLRLPIIPNYVKSDDDLRSLSFFERYDEFRALYPEVELEILTDGHDAWQTKMKTLLASGEVPDVFALQPATLNVFHESGLFYDMAPYLAEHQDYKEGLLPGAAESMSIGDAVYGVPINSYSEGVYYNKEILENNGLVFPKTFDELLNCCEVLSKNGITPIAVGAKDGWPITIITQFLFDREAGYDYFQKAITDEAATMNTPEYKKAFEDFIALRDAGAFSESALGTSELEARSLFMQERAVFYMTGSWDVSVFDAETDNGFNEKVAFANFPVINGGRGDQGAACVGFGTSLCVSNKLEGKELEYALKFVEFCTNTEAASKYMNDANAMIGSKPVDTDSTKVSDLFTMVNEVSGSATQTWAAYGDMVTPAFYQAIDTIGQKVLLGNVTAEQCVEELESARIQFQINQ